MEVVVPLEEEASSSSQSQSSISGTEAIFSSMEFKGGWLVVFKVSAS